MINLQVHSYIRINFLAYALASLQENINMHYINAIYTPIATVI